MPSSNLPAGAVAARKQFLAPAHPVLSAANDSPVTELKITPEELGFSTNKPLSRKQRRRLRRAAS